MKTERRINTVVDMLELSPEEFRRMLPDLALWYSFAKRLHGVPGVENTGFLWMDDGANEITSVLMTDPATGQQTEVS
jgi:hypothetical protein